MLVSKLSKLKKAKSYNEFSEITDGFSVATNDAAVRLAVAMQDLGEIGGTVYGYSFVVKIEAPTGLGSNEEIVVSSAGFMQQVLDKKETITIPVKIQGYLMSPIIAKVTYTKIKAFSRKDFYKKFLGSEAGHHGYIVLEDNNIIAFDVNVIDAAREANI